MVEVKQEMGTYELCILERAHKIIGEMLGEVDPDHSAEKDLRKMEMDREIKELETCILNMFKTVCLMHESKNTEISKAEIQEKLFTPMHDILLKRGLVGDVRWYHPCCYGEDYWTKKEMER